MLFELLAAILKNVYGREVNNQVHHGICPNACRFCRLNPVSIKNMRSIESLPVDSVARIELASIADD